MRFVQDGKTFDFSSGGESSGQPRHLYYWIRTSTHWHLWLLHLHQASTNHGHAIREVQKKNFDWIFSQMEGPGCTVPWLPNKSTICIGLDSSETYIPFWYFAIADEAKRSHAFRLYQGNRRNQNNICDQPCVFTNMYFGPPVKVKYCMQGRRTCGVIQKWDTKPRTNLSYS